MRKRVWTYVGKKVVTVPADVKPYVVARRSQAFGSLEVLFVSTRSDLEGRGGEGKGEGSVLSSKLRTVQESLLFAIDPVVFSDIFVQSPSGELFLFFGQPGSRTWEIRNDEESK
jgi:hypothetical protein